MRTPIVWSESFATARSARPSPLKSAEMICAGPVCPLPTWYSAGMTNDGGPITLNALLVTAESPVAVTVSEKPLPGLSI